VLVLVVVLVLVLVLVVVLEVAVVLEGDVVLVVLEAVVDGEMDLTSTCLREIPFSCGGMGRFIL